MKKFLVLNGPTLNMLGIREPNIYGKETYASLLTSLEEYGKAHDVEIIHKQSNHEGDLVDYIQQAYFDKVDGIVINPGAYTHTSIALLDALKAVGIKTVEVHVSDVSKREDFRQVSYVGLYASKRIMGHGIKGYLEALDYLFGKEDE